MKKTIITVVGNDTVGIIAKVCTYLADNNVNILDISQTIVQGYFNMMMVTDATKCEKDNGVLAKELEDLGKYNEYIISNLQNLDALLLEANHDIRMLQVGKYPYYLKQRILGDRGHLSNENAGRLLCRLLHDNMKAIFLGHLSRENNYEELAYETVCSEVTLGDNPYKSRDFKIQVAKRDCISEVITV